MYNQFNTVNRPDAADDGDHGDDELHILVCDEKLENVFLFTAPQWW